MPDNATLTVRDVLQAGGLLLAFAVAFYALTARERKTPYAINSIFQIAYVILSALLFFLLMFVARSQGIHQLPEPATLAVGCIVLPVFFVWWKIFRLHNGLQNLRHDHPFKNLPSIRWIRGQLRRLNPRKTYEHDPSGVPAELVDDLPQSEYIDEDVLRRAVTTNRGGEGALCSVFHLDSHNVADDLLTDLASRFIAQKCWVQYTSCSRHPVEFLTRLRTVVEKHEKVDWRAATQQLVVVDAFTPHFGFTDSIHAVKSDAARKECLDYISASPSFAGIHTSTALAFNRAKQESKQDSRKPTLVIYEGLHSLVDLESSEQYRIFFTHVLPSERLWGGMFTVVVEFYALPENLECIKTFSDLYQDRKTPANQSPRPDAASESDDTRT